MLKGLEIIKFNGGRRMKPRAVNPKCFFCVKAEEQKLSNDGFFIHSQEKGKASLRHAACEEFKEERV